jgi:cyclopropane-fatty-acyl-phospholipid synthase
MRAKERVQQILKGADIKIDGRKPWDIQVHDDHLYSQVLAGGSLAAGESYMDGWWDAQELDQFFTRIHESELHRKIRSLDIIFLAVKGKLFNRQTKSKSKKVAQEHYDLGNDLYEAMLGKHMQYTCAYWKKAKTLDQAQEQKLDLICKKLYLKPGMTVLELGSGFGMLACYMAKHYKVKVVSYNISKEQIKYGRKFCKGLPVRFEERDYREAIHEEQFDRVVSVGLCEHIGYKNYRSFMELAHAKLKDDGIFLLHTIGGNKSVTTTDPWIDRYIFPGGMIPSVEQLGTAMDDLWVMEDWHNFGPDYDRTLMAWMENFDKNWKRLRPKYGDKFYRMWKYYLLSCAGAFRARKLQLWQIVMTKGRQQLYVPVR